MEPERISFQKTMYEQLRSNTLYLSLHFIPGSTISSSRNVHETRVLGVL